MGKSSNKSILGDRGITFGHFSGGNKGSPFKGKMTKLLSWFLCEITIDSLEQNYILALWDPPPKQVI